MRLNSAVDFVSVKLYLVCWQECIIVTLDSSGLFCFWNKVVIEDCEFIQVYHLPSIQLWTFIVNIIWIILPGCK